MTKTTSRKQLNVLRARARLTKLDVRRAQVVRALLDNRAARCAPRCKGWFVDPDKARPVRCDECASLNGYADALGDDDVCALPAAQRAWRKAESDVDPVSPSIRCARAINWIATEHARSSDVEELSASDAVRAVAHVLRVQPGWLAYEVSQRILEVARKTGEKR